MIKKIENGDVSQIAGGQIVEVIQLSGKGKKDTTFAVVDQNGKPLVAHPLNAEDAKKAELNFFGNTANITQYKDKTGKMVDF